MTSSFLLTQRSKIDFKPSYDDNAPLGGMEDHYIKPNGECHPDFEAIPMNKPSGPKLCRRVYYEPTPPPPPKSGMYLNSRQLYDVGDIENRRWNDIPVEHRTVPNEKWLYERGYFRVPGNFNGTGMQNRPISKYFNKPIYCVEIGRNNPKGI